MGKDNPLPPHVPAKIKDPIPKSKNPGGPHTPGAKAKRNADKKKKEAIRKRRPPPPTKDELARMGTNSEGESLHFKDGSSEGHRLTGKNR